jgi:RNA polymerase sigma factor (sigma-70 family)
MLAVRRAMGKQIKQNELSLTTIVEEFGPMVSATCHRMMQDEETARETAQEIWLEVMESFSSFQGRSKFSTWLYTITHRVAMRHARTEKVYSTRFLRDYFRSGEREMPGEGGVDKEIWVKEMCNKCLTGILHCLTNEARIAYIFRDVVQLPYDEIAQILDKDSGSVRQLISRSRRKLRHFLNNECALQNPDGNCACRMKRWVMEVDLPYEYEKLGKMVSRANVFRNSEEILPKKNFWEKFL